MTSKMGSRALVQQYTEELRHQLDAPVRETKRTRYKSVVRWGIGITFVLTVCGIDTWLLFHAVEETAPLLPEEVRAIERDNPCAQRQTQLMRAILRYEGEFGAPPANLTLLKARFPSLEPVDPVSEKPYDYTQRAGRVVLACPNPGRHTHVSSLSGGGV
jgi:hypothetical protein